MRIITILLNLLQIGIVTFLFIDVKGYMDRSEIFIFLVFFIAPLFNLYLMWSNKGNDWLSLLLKRKSLEEKKKIEKLQD